MKKTGGVEFSKCFYSLQKLSKTFLEWKNTNWDLFENIFPVNKYKLASSYFLSSLAKFINSPRCFFDNKNDTRRKETFLYQYVLYRHQPKLVVGTLAESLHSWNKRKAIWSKKILIIFITSNFSWISDIKFLLYEFLFLWIT